MQTYYFTSHNLAVLNTLKSIFFMCIYDEQKKNKGERICEFEDSMLKVSLTKAQLQTLYGIFTIKDTFGHGWKNPLEISLREE